MSLLVTIVTGLFFAVVVPAPLRAEVSYAAERELGRKFALEARVALPLVDDVQITRYVDHIGQKIVAALGTQPFTYQFFVVRDGGINAFAVPGGYIYVHTGLLSRVNNDAELAGVLGHEVAHVNGHHLARQRDASRFLNYAALLGMLLSVIHPAVGASAAAANATVQLQYQREFEQEADYLGATYMRQAGYDPRGMLDFFNTLFRQQRLAPTLVPPYLMSHPLTDARLNNLEAVLRTHQWDRAARPPLTLDLERVQVLARARSEPRNAVIEHYVREAAAHPESGRARYLLGVAYLETGAYEQARQAFEAAHRLKFTSIDRELGRALLGLRQLEPARAALRRANDTDSEDPVARAELGRVLETLGDSEGALREYESALRLVPTMSDIHYAYGMLAGRTGRPGDGYYHLGQAFMLRGEYEKAVSQFEKAAPALPAGSAAAAQAHTLRGELRDFLKRRGR